MRSCRCGLVLTVAAGLMGGRNCWADDPAKRMNPGMRYYVQSCKDSSCALVERGFQGEYFDLYTTPIQSHYAEVVWDILPPVELPADVKNRFANGVMAVTGHEVNVIRRSPNGEETNVPSYESYNHHYVAHIKGKGSDAIIASREETESASMNNAHSRQIRFVPNGKSPGTGLPAQGTFSEHNGNEARQTYHGLPDNMVVPVEAPEQLLFGPMQINTRNPDGSGRRCAGDCPLPRASKAPFNATYSGLLECPCTTRVTKEFGGYLTQASGVCNGPITTSTECFAAAATVVSQKKHGVAKNFTVSDATVPHGCFVKSGEQGTFEAVFNSLNSSSVPCGALPPGSKPILSGAQESVVGLALVVDGNTSMVTITLTVKSPPGTWYGVGFNASEMAALPYAIVVDGAGGVTEHKLADHQAGTVLKASPGLSVVSQAYSGGIRTTVLQRPLAGSTPDHYTFSTKVTSLPFISAVGSSSAFSQHTARAAATINLVQENSPTCVCRSGVGKINGFPFDPHCLGEPQSDLIKQNNPTCDISLYSGGLACCRGGVTLLDADQNVTSPLDTVYFKWRFYYTEWDPTIHTNTFHLEWQFGHIEYDIPKAPANTSPSDAVHVLTTRFTMADFMNMGNANAAGCDGTNEWCANFELAEKRGIHLVSGGFHCHSPACMGGELYNADTGELLCTVTPIFGNSTEALNEESYIWLPPCQWGNGTDGLAKSPLLYPSTNLTSIKRGSSLYGHTGVMAIWQSRGALGPEV